MNIEHLDEITTDEEMTQCEDSEDESYYPTSDSSSDSENEELFEELSNKELKEFRPGTKLIVFWSCIF